MRPLLLIIPVAAIIVVAQGPASGRSDPKPVVKELAAKHALRDSAALESQRRVRSRADNRDPGAGRGDGHGVRPLGRLRRDHLPNRAGAGTGPRAAGWFCSSTTCGREGRPVYQAVLLEVGGVLAEG